MIKDLKYYMSLPYTIEMIKDPDEEDWFVRVKELEGCMSQGATPDEAITMIHEAMALWLDGALEDGDSIPEPALAFPDYSGKFVVRIPRSLHRKLAEQADRDEVSLNAFVTAALAEAVGYRRALGAGTAYTMPVRATEEQLAVAESTPAYATEAAKQEGTAKKRKPAKPRRADA